MSAPGNIVERSYFAAKDGDEAALQALYKLGANFRTTIYNGKNLI